MKAPKPAVVAHKKPSSKMVKARQAGAKSAKKKNKAVTKDRDAPIRPPTAFLVFMEEFRKYFKEKFPDIKTVSAVGKAGCEKWKSLSDSEKAPYAEKALKKKAEYEKAVESYKKQKLNDNTDGGTEKSEEDSEKSTCEVENDEEQEATS